MEIRLKEKAHSVWISDVYLGETNYIGTPVAAYPVTGPIDFVENGKNGFLSDNLQEAIDKCLSIARHEVREHAILHWTWQKATEVFHNNLFQIDKSNGKY